MWFILPKKSFLSVLWIPFKKSSSNFWLWKQRNLFTHWPCFMFLGWRRAFFAKFSPSPSLRLRWLYLQLSIPPTQPPTHPDKFKFGIWQHNSQKQSFLPIWVGPINAFGSILSPIIADFSHNNCNFINQKYIKRDSFQSVVTIWN